MKGPSEREGCVFGDRIQRGIVYHFPQETPTELHRGGIQITMARGRDFMFPEITCC